MWNFSIAYINISQHHLFHPTQLLDFHIFFQPSSPTQPVYLSSGSIIRHLGMNFVRHVNPSFQEPENTPASIYLFQINNQNTSPMWEICSRLKLKKLGRRQWHCSGLCNSSFKLISLNVLVSLLLALEK